jgi:hypothetical protein
MASKGSSVLGGSGYSGERQGSPLPAPHTHTPPHTTAHQAACASLLRDAAGALAPPGGEQRPGARHRRRGSHRGQRLRRGRVGSIRGDKHTQSRCALWGIATQTTCALVYLLRLHPAEATQLAAVKNLPVAVTKLLRSAAHSAKGTTVTLYCGKNVSAWHSKLPATVWLLPPTHRVRPRLHAGGAQPVARQRRGRARGQVDDGHEPAGWVGTLRRQLVTHIND